MLTNVSRCLALALTIQLLSMPAYGAWWSNTDKGAIILSLKAELREIDALYGRGAYDQAVKLAEKAYDLADDEIGMNTEIGDAILIRYVQTLIQQKRLDKANDVITRHMNQSNFQRLFKDPTNLFGAVFTLGLVPLANAFHSSIDNEQGIVFATANLSSLMLTRGNPEAALQMARVSYQASEALGRSYFGQDARFVSIAMAAYIEILQKIDDGEYADFLKAELGRDITSSVWRPEFEFLDDLLGVRDRGTSFDAFEKKHKDKLDDDAYFAYSVASVLQNSHPEASKTYLQHADRLISDNDNGHLRYRATILSGITKGQLFPSIPNLGDIVRRQTPRKIADLQMRTKIDNLKCRWDYREKNYANAVKNCTAALTNAAELQQELVAYQPSMGHVKSAFLGGYDPEGSVDSALFKDAASYYAGLADDGYISRLKQYIEDQEARQQQLEAPGDIGRNALARRLWAYKELLKIHARAGRVEEALQIAELTKARSSLESATKKNAMNSRVVPEEMRSKLEGLELGLAFSNQRLTDPEITAAQRLSLETERDRLHRETEAFRKQLYQQFPKFEQLSRPQVLGFDEAKKYIPEDAAFVSYVLEGDTVWAFTIADGTLSVSDLGSHANLHRHVESFRKALGDHDLFHSAPARLLEQSNALGKILLDRLPATALEKKRLLISPEGFLSFVPFETLSYRGRMLMDARDVSYVQSLSMLSVLVERQKQYRELGNRKSLLAVANPVYEAPGKAAAVAKEQKLNAGETPDLIASRGNLKRAFQLLGTKWENLPGTEREIEHLLAHFPEAHTLTREKASKHQLKQMNESKRLSDYRLIHFATHGYVDADKPNLSSIVLTQVNLPPGDDGYLSASELPTFDLKSDLVVLSACETGLGKIADGEGVMGLPFALYMAGSVSTVVTLWPVADESTSKLMDRFYALIRSGNSYSSALSTVKREFAEDAAGGLQAPFFWAPFVYYGL